MNDFDDLVFQRLCHLKDAGQTVANQTEFVDLGILSTPERRWIGGPE